MKQKELWIIQTGEPIPGDPGKPRKMRAMNLVKVFEENGWKAHLISSKFDHSAKKFRTKDPNYFFDDTEITLLDSPGYKKNISLARFWDHFVMGINLHLMLGKRIQKPDAIIVGYPPIETSIAAIYWAKKNSIPLYLDIKDQWPHIFLDRVPLFIRPLVYFFLSPYFLIFKLLSRNADHLISISPDFLNWVQVESRRENPSDDIVVYLTSDTFSTPSHPEARISHTNNQFTLLFIGSFMDAFDFSIFERLVAEARIQNILINIIIAGDGSQISNVKKLDLAYPEISYVGWVDSNQIKPLLHKADAFIIPLKQRLDFSLSIPNKAMDAMGSGKMILTSCRGSLSALLHEHHCGFYIDPEDAPSTIKRLANLIKDPSEKELLNLNARQFYESNFNHNENYMRLVHHLNKNV